VGEDACSVPSTRHVLYGSVFSKLARKTNHIERFNTTLRQRVARRVREALSFSKKLAHHLGAITLLICHYNLTRATA
jgi:insertion element IS1 protein InsB